MNERNYLIRKKEQKDCKGIARVVTISWNETYKGNGYGRKLVEEAIKKLKQLGCDKMIIACLKGNPSNEFYKHIGGKYLKDGVWKRLNLPENIYYYENI